MSDHNLINQLKEVRNLKQAPVLWRQDLKQSLLKMAAKERSTSYSYGERFWLLAKQTRLAVAPFRLAPVLAVLLILLGGSVPVARATESSLPGQSLYALKRLSEKVQLSFKTNPLSRGLYYLDLANNRLVEVDKLAGNTKVQAELLRDYNINVGFAQASLQTVGGEAGVVARYDESSEQLAQRLISLKDKVGEEASYKAAIKLTEKLSSSSLALLVNFGAPVDDGQVLASRLQSQIAKVEAKLEGVDGKLIRLPQVKPLKVVIESKQTVVPAKEATKQAKVSLTEAKELVEKKFYTLALQKVQEGEEITSKTEEAIAKTEEPEAQVKGETQDKTDEQSDASKEQSNQTESKGATVELK